MPDGKYRETIAMKLKHYIPGSHLHHVSVGMQCRDSDWRRRHASSSLVLVLATP